MAKFDRRKAYQQRVQQAGSVRAAEQDMREVARNYQAGLAAGLTPAQAATTNYTVKDGDTIATIAQNAGTTPENILQANPDLTVPKAGMVLSTTNIALQNEQLRGGGLPSNAAFGTPNIALQNEQFRSGGLPSNAAFGTTTTNPTGTGTGSPTQQSNTALANERARMGLNTPIQGTVNYTTQPTPKGLATNTSSLAVGGNTNYNPATGTFQFSSNTNNPINQPFVNSQGINNPSLNAGTSPDSLALQNEQRRSSGAGYLSQPTNTTTTLMNEQFRNQTWNSNISITNQFRQVIENGMVPTQEMLDWGVRSGLLQQSTANVTPPFSGGYGGGGFWRGGGRGGGGGGGSGGGGGYQGSNAPAFGSSSAFRGLVNWRI